MTISSISKPTTTIPILPVTAWPIPLMFMSMTITVISTAVSVTDTAALMVVFSPRGLSILTAIVMLGVHLMIGAETFSSGHLCTVSIMCDRFCTEVCEWYVLLRLSHT